MSLNPIHSWFIVAFSLACLLTSAVIVRNLTLIIYHPFTLLGQFQYTGSSFRIVSPLPLLETTLLVRVQCLCANSFSFKSYRLHSFPKLLGQHLFFAVSEVVSIHCDIVRSLLLQFALLPVSPDILNDSLKVYISRVSFFTV